MLATCHRTTTVGNRCCKTLLKKKKWKNEKKIIKLVQHLPTQDQNILERKNKQKRGVRTPFHGRHSIDIPSGEITVEFSGGMEHCTSQHRNKKKSKIKTNIKSVCNTTKGNQQRKKEMYGYVLYCMVVTAATFHAEREPLNLAAYWNTAHHRWTIISSMIKCGKKWREN